VAADRERCGTLAIAAMIGATLGSYRVLRRIGAGGMGVVYLAEHALIGRPAVVKVLRADLSADRTIVERFFNEARSATRIKHSGIVAIFDFGFDADDTAYLVMEHLEGENLAERLRRQGTFGEDEALRVSRQIASALAAAHEAGIVHRDLKPENVFVVADPDVEGGERIKVLDFGVAKLQSDSDAARTKTGVILGSPMFMSPEQCRAESDIDGRADVYALGCLLYALVCGRPPFVAAKVGDVLFQHLREAPPPPRRFRPDLSPEVERLILRCLEKKPKRRYKDMRVLGTELDALRAARGMAPLVTGPYPRLGTGPLDGRPANPAPPPPPVEAPTPPPSDLDDTKTHKGKVRARVDTPESGVTVVDPLAPDADRYSIAPTLAAPSPGSAPPPAASGDRRFHPGIAATVAAPEIAAEPARAFFPRTAVDDGTLDDAPAASGRGDRRRIAIGGGVGLVIGALAWVVFGRGDPAGVPTSGAPARPEAIAVPPADGPADLPAADGASASDVAPPAEPVEPREATAPPTPAREEASTRPRRDRRADPAPTQPPSTTDRTERATPPADGPSGKGSTGKKRQWGETLDPFAR
jgi:serine/threonine protein kinase